MRTSRRVWLKRIAIVPAVLRGSILMAHGTRYLVSATIQLLGVPVVSRSFVGEGYARFDESIVAGKRRIRLEFAAGSLPERAHGFNKLGFLCESVVETQLDGQPVERAESEYFGFMTTSQEKSVEEARASLRTSEEMLTYTIGCGHATPQGVLTRTFRIQLPSHYSWRDRSTIADEARLAAGSQQEQRNVQDSREGVPATFLYAIREAMIEKAPHCEQAIVFNGRSFTLITEKQTDDAMSAVLGSSAHIIRLTGTLQPKQGGTRNRFRLWFECGAGHCPPLRFEYQARPFLRLTFHQIHKENT